MLFEKLRLIEKVEKHPVDPVTKRRHRLCAQLDKQISIVERSTPGSSHRGRWFQREVDGSFVTAIRYGRRDLELAKGKFAIKCASSNELIEILRAVQSQCLSGYFDKQLEAVSAEIRRGFTPPR